MNAIPGPGTLAQAETSGIVGACDSRLHRFTGAARYRGGLRSREAAASERE